MTLLEVSHLSKSFKRRRREPVHAAKDVSFTLEAGRTLALVGESGAGKSTTGRLVLRLIEPDGGRVTFDGVDVLGLNASGLRSLRRHMQMIFQDPYSSLDPHLPIGESVAEPLLVHDRLARGERLDRAAALLAHVGIGSHLLDRFPRELSGGQLQRAAIARALTMRPKMIVCDEPVAALDVSIRAQVVNLMTELQAEMGLAYLFITHDLSLVRSIADDVAIMANGEIVEIGPVDAIYEDPQSPYTRELLDAIPVPVPRALRRS